MTHLVVLLDSDVVYGVSSTDFLLTLGQAGLFRPHWTDRITSDAIRNLVSHRPELDLALLQRRVDMMNRAFPDARIKVPRALEHKMTYHPGDRHVLAAAVHAGASIVLTRNLRHFPRRALAPWGIEALTPDHLVLRYIPLMQISSSRPSFQWLHASTIRRERPATSPKIFGRIFLFRWGSSLNMRGSHRPGRSDGSGQEVLMHSQVR